MEREPVGGLCSGRDKKAEKIGKKQWVSGGQLEGSFSKRRSTHYLIGNVLCLPLICLSTSITLINFKGVDNERQKDLNQLDNVTCSTHNANCGDYGTWTAVSTTR